MISWTAEQWLKGSLAFLHMVLFALVGAVLLGREAPMLGDMFAATLTAILANLVALSGNKALQKVVDKQRPIASKTKVVTSTTTEATPVEPPSPEPS